MNRDRQEGENPERRSIATTSTLEEPHARLALFPADSKSAVAMARLGQHPVERLAKEIDSAAKALPPTRSTRLDY